MKKDFSKVNEILAKAFQLWPSFFEENKENLKGKTSLYFFVQDHYSNSAAVVLGPPMDINALTEAMIFSNEKLCRTLKGDPFNATSFPTQCYAEKKFGGCIVTSLIRITSSGLSPSYEHSFGIQVLKEAGYLGEIEYKNIQAEFEKYKNTGK